MLIQGTLPDTWGEDYKADLNSVNIPQRRYQVTGIQQPEGYISNENMNKVIKGIEWIDKDFRIMNRDNDKSYRSLKDGFIDSMVRINKTHGVDRIRKATLVIARPIFEDYMRLFRRLGYKGDTDYAG